MTPTERRTLIIGIIGGLVVLWLLIRYDLLPTPSRIAPFYEQPEP